MSAAPIVVACPSLALDVTLELAGALRPGGEHRAQAFDARAGGKGVNVVRALRAVGIDAPVTGLLGGAVGEAVAAAARAEGLRLRGVAAAAPTRVCATLAAPAQVTLVYPRAAAVEEAEWRRFEEAVAEQLGGPVGVFVFSGSLPGGLRLADGYGVMERHEALW
jgi:fructose-1-phosphate kinase PfkB-like protein